MIFVVADNQCATFAVMIRPIPLDWIRIFSTGCYGRVVVTTSGSGTVGNFGQSNYGAAKMAVNGLINVLRVEGAKYNILCNAISPGAYTRMTESLTAEHHDPHVEIVCVHVFCRVRLLPSMNDLEAFSAQVAFEGLTVEGAAVAASAW
jgi:NAD(P)-dependent dehydrogenase (short-subunit alcohol dehydrogenase family)